MLYVQYYLLNNEQYKKIHIKINKKGLENSKVKNVRREWYVLNEPQTSTSLSGTNH